MTLLSSQEIKVNKKTLQQFMVVQFLEHILTMSWDLAIGSVTSQLCARLTQKMLIIVAQAKYLLVFAMG